MATEKEVHPVADPVVEYKAMAPMWRMISDIRDGTRAMRAARKSYLPQHPGESLEAYDVRLSIAVFTNFYKKTVDKLVGKPLTKPVVLDEDVPPAIDDLMEDVDRNGTDINVFARNVLTAAMDDGATHVLVEFPVTAAAVEGEFPDGTLSMAQERALDVRPYFRHIKAKDLIGWKFVVSPSGQKILTQIRIRETTRRPDPESEFNTIIVPRIRVYDRPVAANEGQVKVRVFEQLELGEDKEWVEVEAHFMTSPEIPIVTMYTNKKSFLVGEPLLLDFAYLNIAHWQSDSDQRNIVHVARVPILFSTGFGGDEHGMQQEQITVGAGTFTRAPKGATLSYVEHTGKGVDAGQKDLQDLELRMSSLGLEMMTRKPGNPTATAKAIDTAETTSDLGLIAMELESMMSEMLDWFAFWLNLGEEAGGTLSVFKDFGIIMSDATDIAALQAARANGDISRETFWTELKRRGLLSDDFDPEDEIDLLDAESDLGELEDGQEISSQGQQAPTGPSQQGNAA